MLLTALLLAAAAPVKCNLAGAHYVLRGAPGITASFERVPREQSMNGLMFVIRTAKPRHTFRFTHESGNGSGITDHMVAVGDEGDPETLGGDPLDILAARADYSFNTSQGWESNSPAPAHLFLPGLQGAMWYETPATQRVDAPIAFFDLVRCGR